MDERPDADLFGNVHRSGGDHSVGDSMPGTTGHSDGVLHDQSGFTPVDEDTEVPGDPRENEGTVETTETEDTDISELVDRVRDD